MNPSITVREARPDELRPFASPAGNLYRWRPGFNWRCDAQEAGEVLENIELEHGAVTPELVLSEARRLSSPLHNDFEWEDDRAAYNWRIQTARKLVGSLVLVSVRQEPVPDLVRAFVHVSTDAGKVYRSTPEVMSITEYREQVLEHALEELRRWKERYKNLRQLAGIIAALDRELDGE